MHILSTLMRPDGGTAFVDGCDVVRDPDGVRAAIGVTGQFSAVDNLLTGEENLLLMAGLHHLGAKRRRRGWPSCSSSSTSSRPPASRSPPTPAACSAASTSR